MSKRQAPYDAGQQPDRLEKIRARLEYFPVDVISEDMRWLLAEVERYGAVLNAVRRFIDRSLADGYGCPLCKRGDGQYVDGEYWHDDDCLYGLLEPRLKIPLLEVAAGTGEGE